MRHTYLTKAAAVFGVTTGCVVTSHSVQSDSSSQSWISWFIGDNPKHTQNISPGQVYVWGSSFGRIPRPISNLPSNVTKVAAADGFGAVIDNSGKVFAFQTVNNHDEVISIHLKTKAKHVSVCQSLQQIVILDSQNQLQISTLKDNSFSPPRILDDTVRNVGFDSVNCGKNHCIAISKYNEVFSWGTNNSYGQLGKRNSKHDTNINPNKPAKVDTGGTKIRQAACGDNHTMVLDQNGILYGLGNDQWAQLGISAEPWLKTHQITSNQVRKAQLLDNLTACDIAGGGQHTVMLVKDGTIFSFGFNQWGQLGHHNFSSLAPPSPIADFTIRAKAVAAGENHTCIVTQTGELWCIGGNQFGQLGNGTLQPSMTWKKVRAQRKPIKPSYLHSTANVCAVVIPSE